MRPEDKLQAQLVRYLNLVLIQPAFCAAVPNGGKRSKAEAAIMKATGTRAGMPDLIVVAPECVLFLEVKVPKTGTPSAAQKVVAHDLKAMGYQHFYVRSLEDVRDALAAAGITTRGTL